MDDVNMLNRKLGELDIEIDTFFQSVKEIKEIKDTVAALPATLKKSEIEIENQKKELEQLIFNTDSLLLNFEEKAKGLFYDLEQKMENIVSDVKSNLSQLGNMSFSSGVELRDQQIGTLEQISKKFAHMITFYEAIRKFEFSLKINKKYVCGLERKILRKEGELKSSLEKQKKMIFALTIAFIAGMLFLVLYLN